MNILALETSSTWGSIALCKNSQIVFSSYLDIKVTHSERLLPQIDSAFEQTNMNIKDIDVIAVSNGPGSFTGIRIGLSAAKGLCMGANVPLYPVNTLRLMAYNLYSSKYAIMPIIDARMGEIYGALYSNEMEEIIPPCNSKPELFFKEINQEVIGFGSGFSKYKTLLKDIKYHKALKHQQNPKADVLISIALEETSGITFDIDNISSIEPYYLRKSQAELVKDQKKRENL